MNLGPPPGFRTLHSYLPADPKPKDLRCHPISRCNVFHDAKKSLAFNPRILLSSSTHTLSKRAQKPWHLFAFARLSRLCRVYLRTQRDATHADFESRKRRYDMAPVSPGDNKDRKAQYYVSSFADESTKKVGADESPSLRAW